MMRIWTDDGFFLTLKGKPYLTDRWDTFFVAGEDYRGARVGVAVAHIVRYEEVDE